MSWTGPARDLAERIARFVNESLRGDTTESFETLALAIHRWQRQHASVIAAMTEDDVSKWSQIPAVPVGLYKELRVGTIPEGEPARVFRTSGTTGGGRGEHWMRSTDLYDLGAFEWAKACLGEPSGTIIALLEDPTNSPDSSLSHMVSLFPQFGEANQPVSWHVKDGHLDVGPLNQAVENAPGPVFVAATAFALAEWLPQIPGPLPPGSTLMITGGFKGRTIEYDDRTLYEMASQALSPQNIVTEYGMTELSSQLWGSPSTAYRPPPWLRVVAVDPITEAILATGEVGQLRFYDLCNLDGSIGVETLDMGSVDVNGWVTLHGRMEGAPARGCSLTIEESWAKRD